MKQSIKIAIIEDNITLVTMYQTKLEHEGMIVKTAADGLSAIELINNFHPTLVLLDVMMPNSTGLEVLGYMRTRKQNDDIKVIVMTNLDDTKLMQSMKQMGISDYLLKADVTPEDVVAKIHEVLAPKAPPLG